jgi:murein DD-endopeptidase MepM/ murein hydrolase activator NlpD
MNDSDFSPQYLRVKKTGWGLYVLFLLLLCSAALLLLFSCATTGETYRTGEETRAAGVWHRVEEGQTLWRIAKTYRVPLEEIKIANDIQDVVHVAKGTWLIIPDADKIMYVHGSADAETEEDYDPGFIWPLQGQVVNSFGKSGGDFRYGIDIKSAKNQDIVATLPGMVVLSSTIRGYGPTIIIEHENNFCSLYSKNIKSLVREGQQVSKNSVIARAGPEGTAPEDTVHYELFFKGKPVNPLYYLP